MSPVLVGILGSAVLLFLLFMGMPIAFVMMLVGFLGVTSLTSIDAALPLLADNLYGSVAHYPYTIIPLFVIMGAFASAAGITGELYNTFEKWFRRLPGGLGIATIAACAGFAAVSGSSVAAAAAMGTVALPEMKRFKYSPKLATGVIAAGGTLSFLIPPSLGFVIFGMLTEQSIGKLLIAGAVPGLLLSALYALVVYFSVKINPGLAPMIHERVSLREKLLSLKGVWETLLVFLVVMGGIYGGFINPTEAGAIGASSLFLLVLFKRKLSGKAFAQSLLDTIRISVMVIFLVSGATIFSYFLALSTIPTTVSAWIAGLGVSKYLVLIIIVTIYLFLGCFLDAVSMMVLTLPVVYPVIISLGFDPIWFGVVAVLMMEAGLITPPVGLNVYTLAGIARDVPMSDIFKGVTPFLMGIFLLVILLTVFPQIVTFLPNMMGR
ncbi:MAG: C4-dicarboxylate ABC transporter permease [Deltaproteobacteria bacterium CG_4_8_14_3_um_filter_51_11]|nr:TRAP transporter large permease [bacterium]OIP38624.1 MAG: C4-dicarboxylate ABC transporter permease [Desulfobacteraceae bacterium CG2_30_51_40]PIP45385.1 MAG: C4-dicarboxylate ABC transporter permease [Deltaproteobacteria bacterium CG23_combo_of_CG06-09_8_20_14_all_51_20]PIX20556.1 MAG: C4-dicarboxylate ABC transporter permease [Deltaproteobacteria bacterium CG_4_8_14_3_um_filter_51_11]PIY22672.1 MAG: C4-dicarboxylate ABC transporter permease [Deltaproteobacteria bacterium CG_4_10_14_3_um_f